jgi:D-arabinono-1,4-lactone oxidase
MRLQLEPIYDLHRQEWCCQTDDCLSRLDEISRENRNFDFYWYPRCDETDLRCLNRPGKEPDYSAFARLIDDRTGPPHKVIPKHSDLPHRFEEMEYALPAEAGLDCFRELRRRIKSKWRRYVAWRLLFRYIKGDDTWLSEAHGHESVSISLHQNSSLPFGDYFTDLGYRHPHPVKPIMSARVTAADGAFMCSRRSSAGGAPQTSRFPGTISPACSMSLRNSGDAVREITQSFFNDRAASEVFTAARPGDVCADRPSVDSRSNPPAAGSYSRMSARPVSGSDRRCR